ncbi:hypothetical protein [Curtobacterium sp. RRHDQ10]|uniref:hypothetical protein n=1 Tax=Curtobacterium phyllosphaerae TaxID=3413379 RepID=UPI003BF06A72
MSTEAPSRGRPRSARRFRARLVGTVLVLALVAAVSAVVGAGQGPRLSRVSYSATDLVTKAAQRVILSANQRVAPVRARDVSVTPRAAFSVSTSGNAIALEFAGPLRYDASYRVVVRGVTAAGRSVPATLRTSVRTGTTSVLSLLPARTSGAPDRIVRRPLDGAGNTVLDAASDIAEFQRLGRYLVVLRTDTDRQSSIDLVPASGTGAVEHIQMPTRSGRASSLHVADDGAAFGFVFDATSGGRTVSSGLYLVPLSGTHLPMPVRPDGTIADRTTASPVGVGQWAFVPRTESALVRTDDDDLLLVDTTGTAKPVRLGAATSLHGFVGTGTTAIVETGTGIERLDLATGRTSALNVPADVPTDGYLGRIAALTPSTYLRVVGDLRADGTVAAHVERVAGATATTLPIVVAADAAVTGLCPSPNAQLVAVLTRSPAGESVLVADASSGAIEATIEASTVDWCGAVPSGPDDTAG